MRLFGKVNGQIDQYDFCGWLIAPFDKLLQAISTLRMLYIVREDRTTVIELEDRTVDILLEDRTLVIS